MTQVNLLPRETRERQAVRRQTTIAVALTVAAVAVVLFVYVLQTFKISDLNDQIQAQQQQNAALQERANRLQRFEDLRTDLQARQGLLAQAMAGEIAWSSVLQDLSRAIPSSVWLTNLTASLAGEQEQGVATGTTPTTTTTTTTGGATNGQLAGSLSFEGKSLDSLQISTWLTRLDQLPGWVNAWLSKAQKEVPSTIFSFSSTVDLSRDLARGGQS